MLQIFRYLPKNLRNILVCSYLIIIRKLKYPYNILPCKKYKIKLDIDILIYINDVFISRLSNLSREESFITIFNQKLLNDDAIDNIRIANLSVNLIGGKFKKNHTKFLAKGDGAKMWNGDLVYLVDYLKDYEYYKDRGIIFIDAKKIHNIELPYNLHSDPNLHKEVAKFQDVVGNCRVITNIPKQEIKVIGKIFLKHSPTNLNYWHLELKVENYSETIIDNPKKNSDKRFLEQVFTNIIKLNSLSSIDTIKKFDKSYYSA